MSRSAFRFGDKVYCSAHWPGQRIVIDESKIIKREALIGKSCVDCGVQFITESPETPHEDTFRRRWNEEIAAGKAFPIAADLFEGEAS